MGKQNMQISYTVVPLALKNTRDHLRLMLLSSESDGLNCVSVTLTFEDLPNQLPEFIQNNYFTSFLVSCDLSLTWVAGNKLKTSMDHVWWQRCKQQLDHPHF